MLTNINSSSVSHFFSTACARLNHTTNMIPKIGRKKHFSISFASFKSPRISQMFIFPSFLLPDKVFILFSLLSAVCSITHGTSACPQFSCPGNKNPCGASYLSPSSTHHPLVPWQLWHVLWDKKQTSPSPPNVNVAQQNWKWSGKGCEKSFYAFIESCIQPFNNNDCIKKVHECIV